MRMRQKIVIEVVLTSDEAATVRHALDYIHHRQKKHHKALLVNAARVEVLRSQLREYEKLYNQQMYI